MHYFYIFISLLFTVSTSSAQVLSAQEIIDKSILVSGSKKVANATISFVFRDKIYKAIREGGNFELSRSFDSITDVLYNDGFKRLQNNQPLKLSDSITNKYANSVNAVHYFSVLPYGLNDKAVRKELLKSSTIKEKDYYKIKITFSEDGGGEDFEDVFIYWIGKEDFLIDYLAYSYHTNGGGMRFRVLKEQCFTKGIRFVDYYNYKPKNKKNSLIDLDKAFEKNQLDIVSEIVLKEIKVTILK